MAMKVKVLFLSAMGEENSETRKHMRALLESIRTALKYVDEKAKVKLEIEVLNPLTFSVYNLPIMAQLAELIDEANLVFIAPYDPDPNRFSINPNVMYELGICHLAGKHCLILYPEPSSDKNVPSLPFDIKDIRVVYYQLQIINDENIRTKFAATLSESILHFMHPKKLLQEHIIQPLDRLGGSMRTIFVNMLAYMSILRKPFNPRRDLSKLKNFDHVEFGSLIERKYFHQIDLSEAEGETLQCYNISAYRIDGSGSYIRNVIMDGIQSMVVDFSGSWQEVEDEEESENENVPALMVLKDCIIGNFDLSHSNKIIVFVLNSRVSIFDLSESVDVTLVTNNSTIILDVDYFDAQKIKVYETGTIDEIKVLAEKLLVDPMQKKIFYEELNSKKNETEL